MELVEIAVEGPAAGCVGFLPAERGEPDRRDEKAAEKGRGIFTDLPLGEIHQKDFAFIHDPPDVDRLLGGGENPVERGVREECADFVLDRRNSIGAHSVSVFFILVFPELSYLRIFDMLDGLLAIFLIGKEPENVGQRRLRLVEERKERVPENVLHPDTPGLRPHFLENLEEARRGKRALFGRNALQWVVPKGLSGIRHVEKNHIAFPVLRNARHDALDQVAVRIDEHEPLAGFDIGEDEPLEQGRFARARSSR